jgi:hypothetical protein
MKLAVEKMIAIALVVVICLGMLALRLWGELRRKEPGAGDPDVLQRWVAHVLRGDRED